MKSHRPLLAIALVLLGASLLNACGSAQSRKARYIAHGKEYFAAANYDKARVEFRNAAQIDPKDAEVRLLLGEVSEKLGNRRDAFGQYSAAVSESPKYVAARAALGRIYLYSGAATRAIETIEPALAIEPKNPELLIVRGGARSQLGDAKGALEDGLLAKQLAPDSDYAIALLASLYRKSGDLDKADEVVRAGITRMPKNIDLRVMLADLAMAQNKPGDAETQLKKIIELDPKTLSNRDRLAIFYNRQKNFDAAEATLRETIASAPENSDGKLHLIEFLAAQRSKDQAVAQAEKFTLESPRDDTLKLAMGELLVQLGEADHGEKNFRQVIAHSGTGALGLAARDQLASLLLRKNDAVGASKLVTEVLAENARDNQALVLRGGMELSTGDSKAAITDLRAVLRDQPNAVPIMRELARAYQQDGEAGQAEETLRTAVQTAPNDVETGMAFAQLLADTGNAAQAEPILQQLNSQSPTSVPVLDLLFNVQIAQKHFADAAVTATKVINLKPGEGLGYYLAGTAAEDVQKAAEARKYYEQALQHKALAAEPLAALVRMDLHSNQPAAAMARLDATIAKFPEDPIARAMKAEILLQQGNVNAAIAAYQGTVQASPTWAKGYQGLAVAQARSKHQDEAAQTLQLGIDKTGGNAALIVDLGNLYEQTGKPDQAIALYEGLLAKNPKSIFAANNLAMLLVSHRQDAASLARAQQLAELLATSSQPMLIDTRGWVKFKSGDFHAAESLLQQAVVSAPEAPELRFHLAMAQLRSGEQQAAQQNLEAALRSPRPFVGMNEAKSALAQLKKTPSVG